MLETRSYRLPVISYEILTLFISRCRRKSTIRADGVVKLSRKLTISLQCHHQKRLINKKKNPKEYVSLEEKKNGKGVLCLYFVCQLCYIRLGYMIMMHIAFYFKERQTTVGRTNNYMN